MCVEMEMYKELQVCVDEISYFVSKDIQKKYDNGEREFTVDFNDDCLDILLDIYNCRHAKADIWNDLKEEIERYLFFNTKVNFQEIEIRNTRVCVKCWEDK